MSKAFRQFGFLHKTIKIIKKNHIDIGVGVSVLLPVLSRLKYISTVILDDDDKLATPIFAFFAHHNASLLLRPQALQHEGVKSNTYYYNGYHELSYLHPDVFSADAQVLYDQGLNESDTFFVLRLVALTAHHDKGIKGINHDQLQQIVDLLSHYGRIVITSESPGNIIVGTEPLKINPERLHHLLAFARLVISDGQTMCYEAACLGIPSIRISDFVGRISSLEEQEKIWKLTYGFKPSAFDLALGKIKSVMEEDSNVYKNRRDAMLSQTIKVKDFLVAILENYPTSARIMKENPDYQYNFK